MDINATLFFQILVFLIFIGLTMKFVWPPILKAMEERRARIADGLAAAKRGKHDLEVAQHKAIEIVNEAKAQATSIIEQSNQRASSIEEQAREEAQQIAQRMKLAAEDEIKQNKQKVKDQLRAEVVDLVLKGTECLLTENVSDAANEKLVRNMVDQLQGA
jgi:F-type H+-transporting ATPase subunit b